MGKFIIGFNGPPELYSSDDGSEVVGIFYPLISDVEGNTVFTDAMNLHLEVSFVFTGDLNLFRCNGNTRKNPLFLLLLQPSLGGIHLEVAVLNNGRYVLNVFSRDGFTREGEVVGVTGIGDIEFLSKSGEAVIHTSRDNVTKHRTGGGSLWQGLFLTADRSQIKRDLACITEVFEDVDHLVDRDGGEEIFNVNLEELFFIDVFGSVGENGFAGGESVCGGMNGRLG